MWSKHTAEGLLGKKGRGGMPRTEAWTWSICYRIFNVVVVVITHLEKLGCRWVTHRMLKVRVRGQQWRGKL